MIKKELGVYLRVPGSSDQKTDFGRFGYHPTPSCESRAPPGWNKTEVKWNTFIYYKKFDEKTKADAKNFCRDKGEAYYLSLDPRIWVFSEDSLLVLAMNHGP